MRLIEDSLIAERERERERETLKKLTLFLTLINTKKHINEQEEITTRKQ